jgi:hypothetical protein
MVGEKVEVKEFYKVVWSVVWKEKQMDKEFFDRKD